ncbi:MAG: hypothetical protein EA379_11450 [Phycisphaerales bacterium]|nr:MAG: hypothetical protein EA379_11450 [Phycisphaerales bacterium]
MRHPDAGQGRFRETLARVFGDADNPFNWALTLGTVAGIRVRIHVFFVLFIVARLAYSLLQDAWGFAYALVAMSALFVLVLLHEFGHCFACRAVKGEADDILMWPLGGLASCNPPENWRAHLVTTLGGPMVNVAILPITSVGLLLAGMREDIVFNPFRPGAVISGIDTYWLVALWLTHYLNIVLLGFNLLLPIFPLDGGRVLREVLWPRIGRIPSLEVAITIGLVGAIVLALVGLVGNHAMLIGIAAFGGLTCWFERRRLRAPDELGRVGEGGLWGAGADDWKHGASDDDEPDEPSPREIRRLEREAQEQAEVDRILAKIASEGIDALNRREHAVLKRATNRRRRG